MKKLISGLFLVIGLGLLSSFSLKAQITPDSLTNQFFEQLYSFSFDSAKTTLDRLNTPANSLAYHIAGANYYWWSIVTGERSKKHIARLKDHNKALIALLKERPISSLDPEEVFALIHSYAYQTRYSLMKRQYYKGFSNLLDISPYLEIVLKNPHQSDGFKFLAGLYHYMANAAIEKRPIYKPFFPDRLKPQADLGYTLLLECASSSNPMIRTEARYFLMKINLEISENYREAEKWNSLLKDRYPNNMLYPYYAGLIADQKGEKAALQNATAQLEKLSKTLPQLKAIQRSFLLDELRGRTK